MADKKLTRIPEKGQIAGVCAGIAEYSDIDVSVVRVGFILAAIFTGGAFAVAYLVLAIVLPTASHAAAKSLTAASKPGDDVAANVEELKREFTNTDRGERVKNYLGFGLIVLGLWLFAGELFPSWWGVFRWEYVMPLALIIIGIYIATRRVK